MTAKDVARRLPEIPVVRDRSRALASMTSACLWRQTTDDRWHTGAINFPAGQQDPDGSEWLLELLLDDAPEAYRRFAEDYYELGSVSLAAVREVYALRPVKRNVCRTTLVQLLP